MLLSSIHSILTCHLIFPEILVEIECAVFNTVSNPNIELIPKIISYVLITVV